MFDISMLKLLIGQYLVALKKIRKIISLEMVWYKDWTEDHFKKYKKVCLEGKYKDMRNSICSALFVGNIQPHCCCHIKPGILSLEDLSIHFFAWG